VNKLKENWQIMLISFVLALILWFYVSGYKIGIK